MNQKDENLITENEPVTDEEVTEDLNTEEEKDVKETGEEINAEAESEGEASDAAESSAAAVRWMDEVKPADDEPAPKSKGPFIQIPVIISLCLVIVAAVAFFAYKYIFMTEPEGVTWLWHSEEEDADYYFEFTEDNAFKVYVGSYELTASYSKDKSDDSVSSVIISDPSMSIQYVGCFLFSEPQLRPRYYG